MALIVPLARGLAVAGRGLLVIGGTAFLVFTGLARAPGRAEGGPEDFGAWLSNVLSGDLGHSESLRIGASVVDLVAEAAGPSLVLVLLALLFAAVGAAILTWGWRAIGHTLAGRGSRALVYALSSSPAFLVAYWALLVVNGLTHRAIEAGLAPRPAWFPVPFTSGPVTYTLAALALAVGSGVLMEAARGLEVEVDRVMQAEFIVFARANGHALLPHVVPSLIGPLAALCSNRLLGIFGGAVVIETIFAIDGLGRLTWSAALARDTSVLLGASVAWAVAFVAVRFASGSLILASDPRLRVESATT